MDTFPQKYLLSNCIAHSLALFGSLRFETAPTQLCARDEREEGKCSIFILFAFCSEQKNDKKWKFSISFIIVADCRRIVSLVTAGSVSRACLALQIETMRSEKWGGKFTRKKIFGSSLRNYAKCNFKHIYCVNFRVCVHETVSSIVKGRVKLTA